MTNTNYSEMTNQELVKNITDIKVHPGRLLKFLGNHNKELLDELVKRTIFLDKIYQDKNLKVPINARLYCL